MAVRLTKELVGEVGKKWTRQELKRLVKRLRGMRKRAVRNRKRVEGRRLTQGEMREYGVGLVLPVEE